METYLSNLSAVGFHATQHTMETLRVGGCSNTRISHGFVCVCVCVCVCPRALEDFEMREILAFFVLQNLHQRSGVNLKLVM